MSPPNAQATGGPPPRLRALVDGQDAAPEARAAGHAEQAEAEAAAGLAAFDGGVQEERLR